MNKENKKKAQERRAQQRERERQLNKWRSFLPLIVILLAAAAVIIGVKVSSKSATADNTAQSETAASSAAQTDPAASTDSTEALADKSEASQGDIVEFDASSLKGCYDISKDDLTYAQIKVKDYGTITAALDPAIAPISVENFVKLAKSGFYDGLTFHRIIDGFMIQGGDPLGNGTGGSDETIKGEFSGNNVENPITHVRGALSMARSQDPDSASSQFFIVQADSTYLDGQYAGFGYVTDGMDIVDQICKDAKPVDGNGSIAASDQPVIESVTIIE